jgi:hypothetical protein
MKRIGRRPPIELVARTIGVLAATLWLAPLVGALIGEDPNSDGNVAESLGVGVLAAANIVAVAIAWRHPALGGRLLLVTGALFAVFALITAGRNEWLAVAVSGGPFLLSGLLFIASSRNDRSSKMTA